MAAQLASAETEEDIVCPNMFQNIFVLRDMMTQPRNAKTLEVKHIEDTTRSFVLFDRLKVPNYVMCGASMLRCTLYRRQTDVCYACGRLAHRADVCLAPEKQFAGDAEPHLPRKTTSARLSAPSAGGLI
ncbi:hypothetical protein HPB52_000498 [Rhipicephalus sanguineus]|uniref:CCHC-type domain-containing protein n=1 Tax=Rhipicephalus sanguineus TaxID=34632 RepID=A0A9D4SMM6_RHISA|nr:hypothetical protein HPB52_000498 [Rhipicephalus sanguineus]